MTAAQMKKRLETIDDLVSKAVAELELLQQDAQEHFDDQSEKWQEGEKGEAYTELIDALEEAMNTAQSLQDIVQGIEPI